MAEGLAKRIVEKNVPDIILDAVIYSLDMGALLAGFSLLVIILVWRRFKLARKREYLT